MPGRRPAGASGPSRTRPPGTPWTTSAPPRFSLRRNNGIGDMIAIFTAGIVAGAMTVLQANPAELDDRASLQQCYRKVRAACQTQDHPSCEPTGIAACQALLEDLDRARARSAANLRSKVLTIGAAAERPACAASGRQDCGLRRDRGRRMRTVGQAEEAASSLFIGTPDVAPGHRDAPDGGRDR